MTKALNLIGSVIGNWTVLSLHSSAPRRYLCRCTCGVEKDVSSSNLQSGQSTGCGHDKAEGVRISKIKHGALHAFYLGRELARASLAVTLGKTYRQDATLRWGYLTPDADEPKRTRLTARTTRTALDEDRKTRG